jgi:hypothetical protein
VSASTFGPDFHQQFGAHFVEESMAAWRGYVRQAPKPSRLRRQPHRQHQNPRTLRPSSLRLELVPGRMFWRSSRPLRGYSRSALRGWGLWRKTSKSYEGYGLSSWARLWRPSRSRRCVRLRLRRSRPSSRTRRRHMLLQMPSTSTSGKLSVISLCFRVKSPARRRVASHPYAGCSGTSGRHASRARVSATRLAHLAGHASPAGPVEVAEGRVRRIEHRSSAGAQAGAGRLHAK